MEPDASAMAAAALPPAPSAVVVRGTDGIETLDEVMAPALRERIRQLLSAQVGTGGRAGRVRQVRGDGGARARARVRAWRH